MFSEEVKRLIRETIVLLDVKKVSQVEVNKATNVLRSALEKVKPSTETVDDKLKIRFEVETEEYKNDTIIGTSLEYQLPYINREFYEHTFKTNEEVIIGMYVDDDIESFYISDEISVYKLDIRVDSKLHKTMYIESGSQKINLGILPEGEHIISFEATDVQGRKSFRDFFEIRVKDPVEKVVYTMTDEDLAKYEIDKTGADCKHTATGFNQFILDLDEKYNYIIIPNGTYQIKFGEHVEMKDNITFDMNESTFTLQPGQAGGSNIQMQIKACYDTHVINGTIEGDYKTHDYANSPNNSEWVHGINLDSNSKYSSYENVTVKNITGYGSCSGIAEDREGQGYCYENVHACEKYERIKGKYVSSDFTDISKFQKVGFLQLGLYLGYQGKPCSTWYFTIHFYDADKNEIDSYNGYYYRRMYLPENAKYVKVELMSSYTNNTLTYFAFRAPVNCEFVNVKHEMCRCVGMAPSGMESLRVRDCYFTQCGKNGAHCAFDSEDGWDMMHDFYMTGTVFENNYYNDWLTCAGHNFLLENNEYPGSIYIWTRCQNYTIRNNNVKNINEGANKDTHHSRIYNNTANGSMNCSKVIVRHCTANKINGYADKCIVKSLSNDASQGYFTNCRIVLGNDTNYIADIILDNCEITLAEGVTSRSISFNKKNGIRTIKNCRFTGDGKYFLANHNNFNSANFIDCVFESPVHIGAGVFEDNANQILFKNCKMPFEGELIKLCPNAYSIGNTNILFENCELIDIGGGTPDGYHKGENFIWGFSKPTLGSKITFNNCIINKTEGMLYAGYPQVGDNFDLTIAFNNTAITDNLLEVQEKYKDAVKIISK